MNYLLSSDGQVGFGNTKEEAEYDLYVNKCRQSLSNDKDKLFTKRREELKPWLPKENMLHITSVGCLVYDNGKLYNSKTGKSVVITQYDKAIYYYVACLLGDDLSYTDITVVLRPEIDKLFSTISDRFRLIKDMPTIKRMSGINGFEPNIVYTLNCGILVGITDDLVGAKVIGDEMFNVVEREGSLATIPLLSYVGYKIGYIFDEEGVRVSGKEVNNI